MNIKNKVEIIRNSLILIIENEIYHPMNKSKLNLKYLIILK